MLECDYAQPVKPGCYKKNFPENVETIKIVSAEHVVMETDAGQMQNPAWLLGLNDENTEGIK